MQRSHQEDQMEAASAIQTQASSSPPEALRSGEGVSIIIPAYNEEGAIGSTLEALLAEPRLAKAEIVVVDDGSTDRTAAILLSFERIRVVRHPYNRGYGSAIRTGARASKGQYLFWLDSDGQHRIEDLLAVRDKLISEELDYCIGVREAGSHQEANRALGKWLLRLAVNFAAGRQVPDFNSGLRGFRREVFVRCLDLLPKGFGASTLTTLLMIESDQVGGTVPIIVRERAGKSTVNQLRDGLRTLQIILHIVLLFKPLKFFGLVGSALIGAGAVYGIARAVVNGQGIPVLAALVIILGVQSFFFGLLCDQISAHRRERFR
jgi:glycosyltransferase involved in cell wall biosynthesis